MTGCFTEPDLRLQERLGYSFSSPQLLEEALTHPSVNEGRGRGPDYERLEFLGDAVLGLACSTWLYQINPSWHEGDLSKRKLVLVSGANLAELAERVGVRESLRTGAASPAGGEPTPSMIEDALEAVLGAVFLDGGWNKARDVVTRLLQHSRLEIREMLEAKGRLQEAMHSLGLAEPRYLLRSESGSPQRPSFEVDVLIGQRVHGTGTGTTKKAAEQRAAQQALERLDGATDLAQE